MAGEDRLAEVLAGAGQIRPRDSVPEEDDTATEELETVEHVENETRPREGAVSSSVTVVNLFRHPEAHPIVLDVCLLKKYGPDWLFWEAETLEHRIPQDFKISGVSDLNLSKIQACRTLHAVDTFWQRWEVFVWCVMPFNRLFPDFEVMQVPTVAQCMLAVDCANRIRDDVEWSTEVKAYLEVVHRHDGIFITQPPLDFVRVDGAGYVVDLAEVQKLWPRAREERVLPKEDSITREQLRRMLLVNDVLETSRLLLRSQLPLVEHV